MLTGTTELALRALIYLGLSEPKEPTPPKRLAETLGCSPTYLGKTLGLLVKADLLTSVRGARGGVVLARDPKTITLLAVIEACQGTLVGDFCRPDKVKEIGIPCRFHEVMSTLHGQVVKVLSACTLAELLECPLPVMRGKRGAVACKMKFEGAEALFNAARAR
ncbi:MAG: Rrf2 family transcriptional regulator [Planctomycetes bacterium]|nr:Rrf2 family transcriptional regulator [Planctomycetota bacterium]